MSRYAKSPTNQKDPTMTTETLRTIHIQPGVDIDETARRAERYLWNGWKIADTSNGVITVNGKDNSGWTAEALVDRLASGLIFGKIAR